MRQLDGVVFFVVFLVVVVVEFVFLVVVVVEVVVEDGAAGAHGVIGRTAPQETLVSGSGADGFVHDRASSVTTLSQRREQWYSPSDFKEFFDFLDACGVHLRLV
jgi:hypothetical protein